MTISADTSGVFAIAPTPFLPDGAVDDGSLDRMVDFYEAAGVNGLTILGIMGEAPKLEPEESLAIATRIIKRTRLPVIVGVSAPGLAAMRSLTHQVMTAGAAGVMIAPVPSLRTDEQIVTYYEQAVTAIGTDVPFVIQDYPLTLSVVMTPGVIARIVTAHQSCVMLKHEDWPGLEKISALRTMQKNGKLRPLSILTGNGALFLDFEMSRGADGAMTGYAFPELLVNVVAHAKAGRLDAAHDLFDAHLPLIRYEQQQGIGLAVRKYVLAKRGAIAHETQRAPAAKLSPTAGTEVNFLLKRLARHDARATLTAVAVT
jgi:4-hydroxy-tetrahydrodipicolinate synthase